MYDNEYHGHNVNVLWYFNTFCLDFNDSINTVCALQFLLIFFYAEHKWTCARLLFLLICIEKEFKNLAYDIIWAYACYISHVFLIIERGIHKEA